KVREYSEILGEENYLRPPSLNTVRARIDRLDVMYKIERRHGKYAAMKRNQHGGKIYVGDCIGERVEMDSQIVDVLVWDEMHGVTLRPRLTLV
ncbi:hypothetical protein, partial [Klebsiella pneumoniae]|uniref:hypothetical protein n=2 Tax=Pseudomonadota TaxID=1224 RepID=UPI00254B2AF5